MSRGKRARRKARLAADAANRLLGLARAPWLVTGVDPGTGRDRSVLVVVRLDPEPLLAGLRRAFNALYEAALKAAPALSPADLARLLWASEIVAAVPARRPVAHRWRATGKRPGASAAPPVASRVTGRAAPPRRLQDRPCRSRA